MRRGPPVLADIRGRDDHPSEILKRYRSLGEPGRPAVDAQAPALREPEDARAAPIRLHELALLLGEGEHRCNGHLGAGERSLGKPTRDLSPFAPGSPRGEIHFGEAPRPLVAGLSSHAEIPPGTVGALRDSV